MPSQAIGSTPTSPSALLTSPERTPENSEVFQISAATTEEQANGRKNTDRKNARATRTRSSASASPSAAAKVSGTIPAANPVNVSRLPVNAGLVSTAV